MTRPYPFRACGYYEIYLFAGREMTGTKTIKPRTYDAHIATAAGLTLPAAYKHTCPTPISSVTPASAHTGPATSA